MGTLSFAVSISNIDETTAKQIKAALPASLTVTNGTYQLAYTNVTYANPAL